jgi:hypothetical protein
MGMCPRISSEFNTQGTHMKVDTEAPSAVNTPAPRKPLLHVAFGPQLSYRALPIFVPATHYRCLLLAISQGRRMTSQRIHLG